jgi:hypothetical protein
VGLGVAALVPGIPNVNALRRGVMAADRAVDAGRGFSSFGAFKRAMGSAGEGRQWHHIVEQNQVGRFGAQSIHNTDNLVSLPRGVHEQVSAFYSSKQPFTGNLTVRQWLRNQSFDEQTRFGQQVIDRFMHR